MFRLLDANDDDVANFIAIDGLAAAPDMSLEDAVNYLVSREPALRGKKLERNAILAKKFAYNNPDPVLNAEQVAAVYFYSLESPFYSALNKAMGGRSRPNLLPYFPVAKLLCSGLHLLPLPATPQTVYRGVKKRLYGGKKKGDDLTFWAFSSTTASVEVLSEFLGKKGPRTQILIETRSIVDIRRFSAYPSENERLLLPGTMLTILGTLDLGNGLTQIQFRDVSGPHIPLLDFYHPQLVPTLGSAPLFITKPTASNAALTAFPWYADLSGDECEQRLQQGNDGDFMVIPSASVANAYRLSVWSQQRVVNHCITPKETGSRLVYFLEKGKEFPSTLSTFSFFKPCACHPQKKNEMKENPIFKK